MKTGIKAAAGLFLTAIALAHPASAAPDITVKTIPFNVYAQDASATISADGRYLAYKFEQKGNGSYSRNIYIQDLVTGQRIPANLTLTGTVGVSAGCDNPAMSANGRYLVFGCNASLMGGATKGGWGFFVFDRTTNTTQMIPDTGDDRPNQSYGAGISADGRFVAFRTSTAAGVYKIYVRDMVNKTTSLANAQFVASPIGATRLAVSADGRYIGYTGKATPASAVVNASVYDRVTGTTEAVDVRPDGSRAVANVMELTMSEDASTFVFSTTDSTLAVPAANKNFYGTYLRDRKTGKTELISKVNNYHAQIAAVSGNGRYVAYLQGGLNVYDRLTKLTRTIVLSALNVNGGAPRLSSDGRYVAFTTSNVAGNMQSVSVADMGVAANVALSASTLALTEGGSAGTYSMVLTQAPEADVKVALGVGAQLSLARSELNFTADNWNQPQIVSVQAVADGVAQGPHSAPVSHTVTSADVNYSVVRPANVTVSIMDGVTPTVVLPGASWTATTLPLTGTAAPGATVLLTASNRTTGWLSSASTVADAQGQWHYTLTGYTDGVIDLDAQADGIKSVVRTITVALPVVIPALPGKDPVEAVQTAQ